MDWSRIIGNIGRTLIASGVLILLFVVYQLWGTALQERRAQGSLRGEFNEVLEAADPEIETLSDIDIDELPERIASEDIVTASAEDGVTPTQRLDTSSLVIDPTEASYGPPPPPAEIGDAVARLRIPAIDVDKVVVEGVGTNALKEGPGHYPGTPLPGQPGNASIAGHRTTYGAPFFELDELEENDLIYVTTAQGAFQYRVTESFIVAPADVWVLDNTTDHRLTLTTCHPRYSARERLVVVAELIGDPAEASPDFIVDESGGLIPVEPDRPDLPGEDLAGDPLSPPATSPDTAVTTTAAPETTTATTDPAAADDPADPDDESVPTTVAAGAIPTTPGTGTPPDGAVSDGLVTHLDGDRAAAWPAIFWGALAAFVWVGTWYVANHWRRWPGYLMGGTLFLVVLFVFFENFSRLLPPGV